MKQKLSHFNKHVTLLWHGLDILPRFFPLTRQDALLISIPYTCALRIPSSRTSCREKKSMNSPCRTPSKMVYWFYAPLTPKHITMLDRIFKKEIHRVSPRLEQYQRNEQQWNHRSADLWSRIRWWQPRTGLCVKMEASTRLHATSWGGQPYFPHSQAKKAKHNGPFPATGTMAFKG